MKLGILASGEGTTLQAIIDAGLDVRVVLSNKRDAGALRRAEEAGIPHYHVDSDARMKYILEGHKINTVFCAGYTKKVGSMTIEAFRHKILNVHPALLPDFGGEGMYGLRVHEAVIQSGIDYTGITIHTVNEEYDKGWILDQFTQIPVHPQDTPKTLQERVQKEEKRFVVKWLEDLAHFISFFLEGKL